MRENPKNIYVCVYMCMVLGKFYLIALWGDKR